MGFLNWLFGRKEKIGSTGGVTVIIRDGFIEESKEDDTQKILKILSSQNWDPGKLAVVRSMVKSGRKFTCRLAREILKGFRWDEDRYRAGMAIYPVLLDKENFLDCIDVFDWSDNSTKLLKDLRLT